MTRRAALFALTCALVGLSASTAAAVTHYHLLYDPTYRSFCDVSERISCTQVYSSRFSMALGIPVAIFGAIWFAVAALLSIGGLTARESVRESVPGYLFVLSTLALSVILYLGYISLFVIKAICLLCLTTYAAVIGLFLVSGAATSIPMKTLPKRATRDLRVLAASPLAIALRRAVLRRRGDHRGVLPARRHIGVGRTDGADADSGSAVRVRAVVFRHSRACRSSCRPKARRC